MRKIQPRTRFFNYADLTNALNYQEEKSPYYHSLNGDWQFIYLQSPREIPTEFLNGNYDRLQWDTIKVPGQMELQGYGKPNYTNFDFPIPIEPPRVPAENPTGLYYRTFEHHAQLSRQVLRFDGVDSEFKVWINGELLGDGHGSRLMTEFDVTDMLKDGVNTIAVEVNKWSQWSYLEDQDMWWLSGIFRDVTLLEEDLINDIKITPQYANKQWQVEMVVGKETKNENITVEIYDGDQLYTQITSTETTMIIPMPDGIEWNNELPHLYTLVLRDRKDVLTSVRFGLRRVEMIDDQICLNGIPVLFNGVNRHEFNPETGRTLTKKYVRSELEQIKSYHINAIRTSHYPNMPYFYDVCDELGIMVIDECDLETHGLGEAGMPAQDSYWRSEFVERGLRMVHRDFNHPSVLIWSLGNESDFGENFVVMARAMRKLDPSRLIHYEGDRDTEVADMYSTMYTGIDELRDRASKKTHLKPQILCEYGHAMGNGPGSLQDYQDLFKLYKGLQGGFIWEWKDHGILQNTHEGPKYVWGGAFGEHVNDATFCIDGLVRPDRQPSPGLLEYAQVIQPFEFYAIQDAVVVKSLYRYRTLKNIVLKWKVTTDSRVLAQGDHTIVELDPNQLSEVINLNVTAEILGEAFLDLELVTTEPLEIFAANSIIAKQQVAYRQTINKTTEPVIVQDTPAICTLSSGRSELVLDRGTGNIIRLVQDNQNILAQSIKFNLYRDPISNDMNVVEKRKQKRIADLFYYCEDLHVTSGDGIAMVSLRQRVSPPVVDWGIELEIKLWFSAKGVTIQTSGQFDGDKPEQVPRLGYELPLTEKVQQISWYGRGSGESYPDSFDANPVGNYVVNRTEWEFPYVVPQETGNRMDVRNAQIELSSGTGLKIKGAPTVNLNIVSNPEAIETYDILRIDTKVQALGSNSCGPVPLERYQLKTIPFEYLFSLSW